ncbi:MAG TPA: FAD-dependent oxidoreductase [Gemmatimonadaceae bacterium]|nr:FAD-dependent oxidoreductase [Gemmatimonadaceae bacterium]
MIRDLNALAESAFDVLVIGGGVVGACTARDAVLRGLSVALVERDDFASGASWNSLKTLHGGLRSLQHLDVALMREYTRDRSTWMRIAPHLVDLLPVVLPSAGYGTRCRAVLRAALAVSDGIAFDRNRSLPAELHLPSGRLLSRAECVTRAPALANVALTGGALWYDGQMYSPERLVTALVCDAADRGAVCANYVEVTGPLLHGQRVARIVARDRLGGGRLNIRARLIINAAGSASAALAARLLGRPMNASPRYAAALNVMIPHQGHSAAFALRQTTRSRAQPAREGGTGDLFVVPWRDRTIIGTGYYTFRGDPTAFSLEEQQVVRFLEQVNRVWPGRPLTRDALTLVHGGLLPVSPHAENGSIHLERRQRILDHAAEGVPEMLTAVSVRFTTAHRLAERLVDLAARRLGRGANAGRAAHTRLPGAPDVPTEELLAQARARFGVLAEPEVLHHLVRSYGTRYERVLKYRAHMDDWNVRVVPEAPVIRAQLAYGAGEEMAQQPEDLLRRRTEIASRGLESPAARRTAEAILRRYGSPPAP